MSVTEIDIYRSARVIINKYQDEAFLEALRRIARLQAVKDESGVNTWARIAAAIKFLQTSSPKVTDTVQ